MALNPETKYPGRITASDGDYPYGSSKNETAPGAGDGTPYEKDRADDIFGFQQALLSAAEITPSGNPDTATASQYLQAILHQALTGGLLQDAGGVDAYALTATGDNPLPPTYKDGQIVIFDPANTSTGAAATLKIGSLAAKPLKLKGADPFAGALTPGEYFLVIYNAASDRFDGVPIDTVIQATETQRGGLEIATQAETNAGSDDTRAVTPAKLAGRSATTTLAGLIEIATQAETDAGTDDTRAVTPLKLSNAVSAATETSAGVVEIATQAETDAGSDDTRAVTPNKVHGGRIASAVSEGRIKLPSWLGGITLIWGAISGVHGDTNAWTNVNFHTPFGTECFHVFGSATAFALGTDPLFEVRPSTDSVFQYYTNAYGGATDLTFSYFAIGR